MKKITRKVINGTAYVGSKALSKLALPSAVCSTIYDGSYINRGYGGLKTTFGLLYNIAEAYVGNSTVQFREAINGAAFVSLRAMGDAAGNIQDDPDRVIYAALGTFALLKSPEMIRGGVRKFNNWRARRELESYKVRSLESRTNNNYLLFCNKSVD